ncbi:Flavohemoprotein [Pseudobythopirellula maris]|uniref:Flavohemoprotein n=1 Tax=Pseudobythopirellula maris TaxID=2527991 RepID=A0A5C5ZJD8_9BACT|nr:2Fe-2S iron-sulfur cluster-binding protein [Pseudobythopirellula maris]TWT87469.1 Flavohemoprotein [Pseudobythopirellula maris]
MDASQNWMLCALGATLCAGVVVQLAAGGVAAWRTGERRRRRAERWREAFLRRVEAVAAASRARDVNAPPWEGERPMRVASVVDEAEGLKSFYLTPADGQPLPGFMPGQYLTLSARLPSDAADATAPDDAKPTVRCYSLSDRPREEFYRLTIKREPADPNRPGSKPGVFSGWMHDHTKPGDVIACKAPSGGFFLNPADPRPVVLIAGGIGVTPMMSMLLTLDHLRSHRPAHAFFAFRTPDERPYDDDLRRLAASNDRFKIHLFYSKADGAQAERPPSSDAAQPTESWGERITVNALSERLPSNNFDYYICGPPRMMHAIVPDLLAWGVPPDAIHYEAFGPASVKMAPDDSLMERAKGSVVRFAGRDCEAVWNGEYESLLELAESLGVPLASGCRAGNCGACRVRVLEGKTATTKPPGATAAAGDCLACISLPEGPVVLEA